MRHVALFDVRHRVLLAITMGWLATACADNAASAPAAQLTQTDPHASATASPEIPDVTVTPPTPPTDQELAGDSLNRFVVHHATVHYDNTGTTRNLARWRGGMQSICPLTVGLDPGYNTFVTARIRAVAAYVGAPVQSGLQCKDNVRILFTTDPESAMKNVMEWASVSFRAGGWYAKNWRLIEFKGDHAIQGWYMTTRGGARVLNTDMALVGIDLLPVWPEITQNYVGINATGTRLGGGSGSGIGIGTVILIVDTTKAVGYTIGTIADYLAMLTLSMVQSPDYCDLLPSILDLMSSSCGGREMPTAITAGDLAFLKALYYLNTGLGPSLSRDDIQDNMMRQFKRR